MSSEPRAIRRGLAQQDAPRLHAIVLSVSLFAIAIVSQGVHDIAIEHLGIPYPTLVNPPLWLGALGDGGRVFSLVIFALLARRFLDGRSLAIACLIVGTINMCLSERVRLVIITTFVAEAWRDGSLPFIVADFVPPLVTSLVQGAVAVWIARRFSSTNIVVMGLIALLIGAAIRLGLTPAANQLIAFLKTALDLTEPQQVHSPPYGGITLAAIYLTFIEPTLAAFFMVRLTWSRLPGSNVARVALFTVLILGCTGRVTSFLLTTFWVDQPFLLAVASTGQFAAETALMAALVACLAVWHWRLPSADRHGS